jgi:hypothetical protein
VFGQWAFRICGADLQWRWWLLEDMVVRWGGVVVEVIGGGFYYAVVGEGGWRWTDNEYDRAWLLVSALAGEGYQQYTVAL